MLQQAAMYLNLWTNKCVWNKVSGHLIHGYSQPSLFCWRHTGMNKVIRLKLNRNLLGFLVHKSTIWFLEPLNLNTVNTLRTWKHILTCYLVLRAIRQSRWGGQHLWCASVSHLTSAGHDSHSRDPDSAVWKLRERERERDDQQAQEIEQGSLDWNYLQEAPEREKVLLPAAVLNGERDIKSLQLEFWEAAASEGSL